MTLPQLIVFIDEESDDVQLFVRALEEAEFRVHFLDSADEAWAFFENAPTEPFAVVMDVMMPPGRHIENEAHHDGLRTGVFLYRHIVRQCGGTVPVAVLTNATSHETFSVIDTLSQQSSEKKRVHRWSKNLVTPRKFVVELRKWLESLEPQPSA